MSDNEKILSFPSKAIPDCPVEVVDSKPVGRFCHQHLRVRFDLYTRTAECADCGQVLDPFNYLVNGAHAIRRGWEQYKNLENLIREKQEAVNALEKERRRLQPIVKRLREKAGKEDGTLDMRTPL